MANALLIGIGDSILAGNTLSDPADVAFTHLGLGSGVLVNTDYNIGGTTLNGAHADLPNGGLHGLYQADRPCIVFIQRITNDFGNEPVYSAEAAQRAFTFLVAHARAAGFYVAVSTMLPRGANAQEDAKRHAWNDWVRANSAGADVIVDVTLNSTIGADGAWQDTDYYSDLLHLTPAGQAVYKTILHDALLPMVSYAPRARTSLPSSLPYLQDVPVKAMQAYGMKRIFWGYAGPLYQLTRASDGATRDVFALADDNAATPNPLPDLAGVATWAAGTTVRVTRRYDQRGFHLDETPIDGQTAPLFDPAIVFKGVAPAIFNSGKLRARLGNYSRPSDALAVVQGIQAASSSGRLTSHESGYWAATTDDLNQRKAGLLFGGSVFPQIMDAYGGLPAASAEALVRCNPTTIAVSTDPNTCRFFARGAVAEAAGTRQSVAVTNLIEGANSPDAQSNEGSFRSFVTAVYDAQNPTAMQAIVGLVDAIMGFEADYRARVVTMGAGVTNNTIIPNLQNRLANFIAKNRWVEVLDCSQIYQRMQELNDSHSSRIDPCFTDEYGAGRCFLVIGGAECDFFLGVSAADAYAATQAIVSRAKSLGYVVITTDALPTIQENYSNTAREAFNALVADPSTGADYHVSFAATPLYPAAAPNNPVLFNADRFTPTQDGEAQLSGLIRAAPQLAPWFADPATAITLAGPLSGTALAPLTYSLTANGRLDDDVTIEISEDHGGTISPATVTLGFGQETAEFTETPIFVGNVTLSFASDDAGALSLPSARVVTIAAPVPRPGTITSPPERTVALRKKDDSPYLLIAQAVDPSDEIEVTLDFSPADDPLFDAGEHIDFVVAHVITPEAGALGYSLALGSRRTKVDLPNDKLSYIMVPDPAFASNAAFNGDGVPVLADTTIKTTVPEGQDYHIYQRRTGGRRKQK